jgi:amidase
MLTIPRKKTNLITLLSPDIPPIAEVSVGETFAVEAAHHLYMAKETLTPEDTFPIAPKEIMNPLTGPIKVCTAEPGDTLVIKILDIVCEGEGDVAIMPGGGLLRSRLKTPKTMIVPNDGKRFEVGDGIFVPMRPMIGSIGTTPLQPVISLLPGPHGGNLDDPNITAGVLVHLPVYVPGANLALGDVHAAQADGEGVCPQDINALITLRVERIDKQVNIPEVRIETWEKWIIDKEADTVEEALEKSALAMLAFLQQRTNLTDEQAGFLMTSVGGFHLSQAGMYDYPVICRAEMPKNVDTLGRL